MKKFTISTSNQNKINEMKEFFGKEAVHIENGKDVKEVMGTLDEVIIYKALEMGDTFVTEDTILYINGVETVDIRYQNLSEILNEGDKLKWITSVGYNDNGVIYVYRGEMNGVATLKKPVEKGFAFDPFLIPEVLFEKDYILNGIQLKNLTLTELNNLKLKSKFSARIQALTNFKNNNYIFKRDISSIPQWEGTYQNEN